MNVASAATEARSRALARVRSEDTLAQAMGQGSRPTCPQGGSALTRWGILHPNFEDVEA